MGIGMRLTLLMLTAILSDNVPPVDPPGSDPGVPEKDIEIGTCPVCGLETDERSGDRFWCPYHGFFTSVKQTELGTGSLCQMALSM
jgi:hypothetical protein